MQRRGIIAAFVALLVGGAGALVPSASAATAAGCTGADVRPTNLRDPAEVCANAGPGMNECRRTVEGITNDEHTYSSMVAAACGKANSARSQITNVQQNNAQSAVKGLSSDAATAMSQLVEKGKQIQRNTVQNAQQNARALQKAGADGTKAQRQIQPQISLDRWRSSYSSTGLERSGSAPVAAQARAVDLAAEFVYKLEADLKNRAKAQTDLESMSNEAGNNAKNGGAAGDKDSGMKPSDMAALAGPLSSLAGLAGQQGNKSGSSSDPSSLSGLDPSAASSTPTADSSTPSATSTPSSSYDSSGGSGSGSNGSGSGGSGAGTTTAGTNLASTTPGTTTPTGVLGGVTGNTSGFNSAPTVGSGLSSSSGSHAPYADAFTGYGANGTSLPASSTGASSFGGMGSSSGGSAGGSAGSNHDAKSSAAEEEALSSFGGGGLNFPSNGGGSGGDHSLGNPAGEEPVKDFLQNAESSLDLGEATPEEEAEAGVDDADGPALFDRIKAAVERSQRKGAVMSGLGAGSRTR